MKFNYGVHWLTVALLLSTLAISLGAPSVLAQEPKPAISLRLVSSDYSNPVTPGVENPFRLVITNVGSGAVTNVRLYSYQPKDWVVELAPQSVARIGENSLQTVDVNVRPPDDAGRGYFSITITAEATETTGILDFSVSVERATSVWLWIGLALAAIAMAGFILLFMRYGRQ